MRRLAVLPLPLLRGLGLVLGLTLWAFLRSRRQVVWSNLKVCFPEFTPLQRHLWVAQTFIHFAQAWLDRSWLWHAPAAVVQQRLRLTGALGALNGPVVVFAPHFMGLDAGWTALTLHQPRRFQTIYFPQVNTVVNDWILQGRQRFGDPTLLERGVDAQRLIRGLRAGQPLYLLPDLNYEPLESLFVPFFGQPAATLPALSRFARLGRAQVVPVLSKLTRDGYEVVVLPPWADFPGKDLFADTLRMNQQLEAYIRTMPTQYYWVHRRFKDLPLGSNPVYQD
jgi:KDO2-lipid IV(A) lauroyltransferase